MKEGPVNVVSRCPFTGLDDPLLKGMFVGVSPQILWNMSWKKRSNGRRLSNSLRVGCKLISTTVGLSGEREEM